MLTIYIIGALLTTMGTGVYRGSRYASDRYNSLKFYHAYEMEDLFVSLLTGAIWPAFWLTAGPYLIGMRAPKYIEQRKKRKADRELHEARAKKRREKELAAYMPEVEKAIASNSSMET